MRSLWQYSFCRFGLVGLINTLFGYSVFALFIYLDLSYPLAALLSTLAGIIFSFKSQGTYVFYRNENALFWRFIAVYGCLYLLNVILLAIGVLFISNMYFNGAICAIINACLAYLLNHQLVFREEP